PPPVLELKGITKQFPGVLANDNVNLILRKGKIHALLGENGAGKSTLMNILYGLYTPTKGEIHIDGKLAHFDGPTDAIAHGIGMVHQHFMLVPVLTVAENVMLGEESMQNGVFLDRKTAASKVNEISEKYNLRVDPNAYVGDLPVGLQQRVEIIKVLYRNAKILILDEPTAVLTPQEVDELFKIMKLLASQGVAIVFITHKLKEVLAMADRITVIRRGKTVGTAKPAESTEMSLAELMVGRPVELTVNKKKAQPKDPVLQVKNLFIKDQHHGLALDDVSFDIRSGEVLGVAGIQGNGQTEVVEAITGLHKVDAGTITIDGTDVTNSSPRRITELEVSHVPEDRHRDGLVLSFPIRDNVMLNTYYNTFANGIVIDEEKVAQTATAWVEAYDVRTPSIETTAGSLSGGNQQKLIVAREFSRPLKLLVVSQPTRGVDVGSIEYIHARIIEKRDAGAAVLVVSTELDEVRSLSDRIAVMYDGKIVAIIPADEVSKEQLGLLMAGIPKDEVFG
ncbi:ABC transporter ATP-binding protein, partial [Anaerolineales bacterium HSG25]|nr:ABC transporter ATP-binding protein [Anaerolineales bacterium HSG25]